MRSAALIEYLYMVLFVMCLLFVTLLVTGCGRVSVSTSHDLNLNFESLTSAPSEGVIVSDGTFTFASWNLQVFGEKKANDQVVMDEINETVMFGGYDVVFFQEIRNENGLAWERLCQMFKIQGYSCKLSSRAGTTQVKEQVGMIYSGELELVDWQDYNFAPFTEEFERPPIMAVFSSENYTLKIFNLHVDPDKVVDELRALERLVVNESGNVAVSGDMNADCGYYNPLLELEFDTWYWAVPDIADTTSHDTDCAYDRIILNLDARGELVSTGLWPYTNSSDHYLVWAKMKTNER